MRFVQTCLFSFLLVLCGEKFCQTQEKPAKPSLPVVLLKVQPKDEPRPVFRYPLFPETRDLVFGNAAQSYYRAFSPEWMTYHKDKDYFKKQEKWLSQPLAELNVKEINQPQGMLAQVREASLRSHCDWDMVAKLKKEGYLMLLPDVQGMREIARALSVDCRVRLKQGDVEGAIGDIRTGLVLGHHLGNGPTLIQSLVGIAISRIMFTRLEELIQQEGSPNFYWALTALPTPLVDIRQGFGGEAFFFESTFPGLREMVYGKPPRAYSQEEIDKSVGELIGLGASASINEKEEKTAVDARELKNNLSKQSPSAKTLLQSHGLTAAVLDKLPALQVVFMAEILHYDLMYQDLVRWRHFPYPIAKQKIQEMEMKLPRGKASLTSPVGTGYLAPVMLPSVGKCLEASCRLERQIAALRVVEAARLQAARDGRWPDSIEQITAVPLPADPLTDKPFGFKKEGKKIFIIGSAPEGEPPHAGNYFTYLLEFK
ncbi:MAG: hypothetical protein EXR99_15795 [Gemmataceae bacterium]|nr:hypothetical protein [Gemmataceae bacterium]